MKRLMALSALLMCVAAAVLPTALATATVEKPFLLHIDSYYQLDVGDGQQNCHTEWSAASGLCHGSGGGNAEALGFRGKRNIEIAWHAGGGWGHLAPPGYERVMRICWAPNPPHCQEELIGSIVMPNGPFSVQAGTIGGRAVLPDDANPHQIGKSGGPLGLYDYYHSKFYDPNSVFRYRFGYVFRFSGFVRLK